MITFTLDELDALRAAKALADVGADGAARSIKAEEKGIALQKTLNGAILKVYDFYDSIINDYNTEERWIDGLVLQNPIVGDYVATPGANSGDGTVNGIDATLAIPEIFTLTATSSTSFDVRGDASGPIGTATVGLLFAPAGNISFTIVAGGTPFSAGDSFVLTNDYIDFIGGKESRLRDPGDLGTLKALMPVRISQFDNTPKALVVPQDYEMITSLYDIPTEMFTRLQSGFPVASLPASTDFQTGQFADSLTTLLKIQALSGISLSPGNRFFVEIASESSVAETVTALQTAVPTQGVSLISYVGHGNGSIVLAPGIGPLVPQIIPVVATSPTSFSVGSLGTATVGTPFVSAQVLLTITAGGTAFQAGDTFTIEIIDNPYYKYDVTITWISPPTSTYVAGTTSFGQTPTFTGFTDPERIAHVTTVSKYQHMLDYWLGLTLPPVNTRKTAVSNGLAAFTHNQNINKDPAAGTSLTVALAAINAYLGVAQPVTTNISDAGITAYQSAAGTRRTFMAGRPTTIAAEIAAGHYYDKRYDTANSLYNLGNGTASVLVVLEKNVLDAKKGQASALELSTRFADILAEFG